MGAVGAAVSIVGGLMSAYGSYQQGQAQQESYNFQADQELKQAERDVKTLKQNTEELKGVQKTTMAANGVYSNSDTYMDILADTAYKSKMDEITIEQTANERAVMLRKAGSNAAAAGTMGAMGSLLGSAAQIANTWSQWKKTSQGKTPPKG